MAQGKSHECYKEATRLASEFDKAAGYKINIQKSIIFLLTCIEQVECEIKVTSCQTTQKDEILGMKLTRDIQDLLQNISERNFKKLK